MLTNRVPARFPVGALFTAEATGHYRYYGVGTTSMAETIQFQPDTVSKERVRVPPLTDTPNAGSTAVLLPPAALTMSKLESTTLPLALTLNTRCPTWVVPQLAKCSVTW